MAASLRAIRVIVCDTWSDVCADASGVKDPPLSGCRSGHALAVTQGFGCRSAREEQREGGGLIRLPPTGDDIWRLQDALGRPRTEQPHG